MNPGPMADVAMRNIAPSRVERVLVFIEVAGAEVAGAASTLPVADLCVGVPVFWSVGVVGMDMTIRIVELSDKTDISGMRVQEEMCIKMTGWNARGESTSLNSTQHRPQENHNDDAQPPGGTPRRARPCATGGAVNPG